MPDILILSDGAFGVNDAASTGRTMVWVDALVGYFFAIDNDNPDDFNYLKTIDGGVTWAAPVEIASALAGGFILSYDTWYEKWTPGGSGDNIHIVYARNQLDGIFHRRLDVTTDVLSGEITIFAQANAAGSSPQSISVTKSRGGNLYCSWDILPAASGANGFRRSIDNGNSWTARADPFEGDNDDQLLLFPGNEADNQDIWGLYLDQDAMELSLKTYDNSGDAWAEALITTGITLNATFHNVAGSIRHSDNHLFVIAHLNLTVAHDCETWDINGAASIVQKTNVFTGLPDKFIATIMIDQNSNNIRTGYTSGATPFALMDWVYKISTDGGTTWSGEIIYTTTQRAYRTACTPISVLFGENGRWQPSVWDVTAPSPDDAWTNFGNSVEISGQIPPTPNPPAPIIAEPAAGQAGTILYITPDNREYQLITPHDPGRHVLSFQGLGMPPIEYVRQRGPFQDGESVKDFFLRPRTVQILERQNFCDRDAWWNGRSTLLNELRPNRQTTPDGTTPGRLRFFRTDGTARDLRVFISTGPIFEPRVSTQWDEWSFQELLRFIAYDPVFFSTAQTVSPFVIDLDDDLVFPITFPIQFGDGLVDDTLNITYAGTWETFPIITIVGPIQTPRIDNNTTGEKLEFTIDIAPGQTVTIDLTEGVKTVTDQAGNNLIGGLTTDSDVGSFHIAPDPEAPNGVNVIRFRGSNPSGSTSVSLAFFTRFIGM